MSRDGHRNPTIKHLGVTGTLAVVVLTAACAASHPAASLPAAQEVACTTVPIVSTPAAATSGQHPRPDSLPRGLSAVAGESFSSIWAVGSAPPDVRPLKAPVAHWNGAAWTTLSPAGLPRLSGLVAVAAFPGGAWAVGEYGLTDHGDGGGSPKQLIVRLAGTTMRRVPVPAPDDGELVDVAATSASNAWAVGPQVLLHWNGTVWTRTPVPAGMRDGVFTAVAASSAKNAWAVTYAGQHVPPIMHWNGRRWRQVASPDIGRTYALSDVATTSASEVWAVGSAPEGSSRALLLHWNGRSWTCAFIRQINPPQIPRHLSRCRRRVIGRQCTGCRQLFRLHPPCLGIALERTCLEASHHPTAEPGERPGRCRLRPALRPRLGSRRPRPRCGLGTRDLALERNGLALIQPECRPSWVRGQTAATAVQATAVISTGPDGSAARQRSRSAMACSGDRADR